MFNNVVIHMLTSMFLYRVMQEPSPFAIAKLLETGLVNMPRVEVLWKTITGHLLEVSITGQSHASWAQPGGYFIIDVFVFFKLLLIVLSFG
jgi:hypothetical protein